MVVLEVNSSNHHWEGGLPSPPFSPLPTTTPFRFSSSFMRIWRTRMVQGRRSRPGPLSEYPLFQFCYLRPEPLALVSYP